MMINGFSQTSNSTNTDSERKNATNVSPIEQTFSASNISNHCRLASKGFGYLPWRNEDSVISYDTLEFCGRILTGGVIPVICMIGISANVINCRVFYKQGLGNRINFLLCSLAFTDLVADLYIFVLFIERFYSQFTCAYLNFGPVNEFLTNSGFNAFTGFTYASGFLSMLIASERCVCVVKPFDLGFLLKTRTLYVIVIVTTVVIVCVHYIPSERNKIACVYDTEIRMIVYTYFPSEFYSKNREFVSVLAGVVYGLILPFLFIIVTIAATTLTSIYLKSATKFRKICTNRSTRSDSAVTKMLIATSCLFIICRVPDIVNRVTPLFVSDFRVGGRLQNMSILCTSIVIVALTISSSFNIFIYIKMGSLYRKTLKNACR